YRRVALLGQLELEPGHLRDLARDPRESLLDTLPELVVNCEVAALDIDPHPASCPSWRVGIGWYGRGRPLPRPGAASSPRGPRVRDCPDLQAAGRAQRPRARGER